MLGATNQKKKRKRKYVSLSSGVCVCAKLDAACFFFTIVAVAV